MYWLTSASVEEEQLQRALGGSLIPDASMSVPQPSAPAGVDFASMSEEEQIAYAMKLSMETGKYCTVVVGIMKWMYPVTLLLCYVLIWTIIFCSWVQITNDIVGIFTLLLHSFMLMIAILGFIVFESFYIIFVVVFLILYSLLFFNKTLSQKISKWIAKLSGTILHNEFYWNTLSL